MRKMQILISPILFAFSFMIFSAANAQQNQNTASAYASATIVTEMAGASRLEDMNFDNIQSNSADQKVISDSNNNPASFNIISDNYAYSITLPANDILLTKNGGVEKMEIGSFNVISTKAGSIGGEEMIVINAVLNVKAFQAEGNYSTETPPAVTVNYN